MGNCFMSSHYTPTTSSSSSPPPKVTTNHETATQQNENQNQNQNENQNQNQNQNQDQDQKQTISSPTHANGHGSFFTAASDSVSPPIPSSLIVTPLRGFSYADLRAATRNFRPDSVVGTGGFGRVFRGHIDPHTFLPARPPRPGIDITIAVKKLDVEGPQGHKEWLAEISFLGELHHPNLVKLIGFCAEGEHRLLVYEFMNRGSLDNHLFRRGNGYQALSWAMRMKIAVHAAQGLSYLHTCERPIIYRDFKSANILLDSDFNAKLSDFGLAKDGPTGDQTHVTTRVLGTLGYAAPEYVATGRLTSKSDVYGYGVVLLEILTGRKAVDENKSGQEKHLVEWAMPFLTNNQRLLRIMDQKLNGQYSLKGAKKVASLALHCLTENAKLRPTMKQALDFIEPLYTSQIHSSSSITTSPYRSPVLSLT